MRGKFYVTSRECNKSYYIPGLVIELKLSLDGHSGNPFGKALIGMFPVLHGWQKGWCCGRSEFGRQILAIL